MTAPDVLLAGQRSRSGMLRAGTSMLLSDEAGLTRTGEELDDRVARLAAHLERAGLARGRVGLWFRNSIAAMEAFLAVERVAGVRIPADPTVPAAEAESIFSAAEVDLVLTDPEHAPLLGDRPHQVYDDRSQLPDAADSPAHEVGDEPCLVYARTVRNGSLEAVTFSYRNWDALMETNTALYRRGGYGPALGADELLLTTQQIMHGTGILGTLPFVCMGLPQLILPGFDADAVVAAIARHRVTTVVMTSAMVERISTTGRREQLSSLRRVVYGGAPLSRATVRDALATFGLTLAQVYGRMDAGWPLSVLSPEQHAAQAAIPGEEPVSCGTGIPEVEMSIGGRTSGPTEGLLRVRSAMTTPGALESDGWCSTGDLMRRDAEGLLYHLGRTDRQITSSGYHIYPEEIEQVIDEIEGIVGSHVVSEPDPTWGTTLVAYLITDNRCDDSDHWARVVADSLMPRLAKHKVPRRIKLVDALPR